MIPHLKLKRQATFLLVLLVVVGFDHPALSQPAVFRFDHFTSEQGLSHNTVTSIAQDKEGFLWFGTEDGLNRFDGYAFHVYKYNPADSTSLRSSWIRTLFVGNDGTLWVGTVGLHRYDPLSDSFVRYQLDSTGAFREARGEVFAIAEDTAGALWVGTTLGLYRMARDRKAIRRFTHDPSDARSLSSNSVMALLVDRKGTLWVGTDKGVDRFDPETESFRRLDVNRPDADPHGKQVHHLYEDRSGILWLSLMDGGIIRYDPESHSAFRYHAAARPGFRIPSDIVFAATQDASGRIWVGHVSGITLIDPAGKVIRSLQNGSNDKYGLSGSRVYAMYCDRAGTVWLGTAGGGVNRFDTRRNRFGIFRGNPLESRKGGEYAVYALLEDRNGSLWVGSSRGLERFNRATVSTLPAASAAAGLKGDRFREVIALFQDRDGFLWVGYLENRNLERIDTRTGAVREYPLANVRSIFQDRDGEMWIGFLVEGVARLDAASGQYRMFHNNMASPDSLQGGGVWVFYEDSGGRIWMGTWGTSGLLNLFDKSTGRFSRLVEERAATAHNAAVNVRAIAEGPDGALWLGTWGNGLQRYDPRTGTFEYFYEQQGLPNNFVKGVIPDGSGNLWLSTERGLSRFEVRTRTFRNYSTDDGLQGNFFLSGSACRSRDGMLWFGGDHGFNFFHPDSIRNNLVPPPVVITGFGILGKEQPPSNWRGKTVNLGYNQDFISFEFVGLDYSVPARNRYAYRLEGFDQDWIDAGTRRYAAYTHLDGGSYTFRVRASNGDGVWDEEGASMEIVISPPFWEAWWFRLGVALTVLAAIMAVFQIRLRHQLALERLRQRIASDLHDDVGTELSSIVVGSQYLARTLPLKDPDRSQIETLGAIASNAHEMMRDIVWVLRSDNDTLDELVVKMREVAGRLLAGTRYDFQAPATGRLIRLRLEVKRNLFLFFKEALNNIVRHSGATEVEISLTVSEHVIDLRITDNGRGFELTRGGAGSGLKNLYGRADTMRASLSIRPGRDRGTVIHLGEIPT